MHIRFRSAAILVVAIVASPRADASGFIPDRATLDALVNGNAVTEGFERYVFSPTGSPSGVLVTISSLDSQTITSEFGGDPQGPGLVVDGVRFIGGPYFIWTSDGSSGLHSQTIRGAGHIFSSNPPMAFQFTQPTTAFGVDMELGANTSDTVTVTVFGPDLVTILGTMADIPVNGPVPVFVGFSDPNGIGLVQLQRYIPPSLPRFGDSVIIDNLTFGPASTASNVPEPATALLLALGLSAIPRVIAQHRKRVRTSPPAARYDSAARS
jgi:hypothetical protein